MARPVVEAVELWTWEWISHEAFGKMQIPNELTTNRYSDHIFTIFIPGWFFVITLKENKWRWAEPAVAPRRRKGLSALMSRLRAAGRPSITHRCSVSPQIVAAILAIAGIVMMTYADGFHSHSVIGITLVVASASMSALYKVFVTLSSKRKKNTHHH